MARWEGKTRGGYLGYAIFVFFIRHLPLSLVYFILRFVVLYYLFFAPRSVRNIYRYFRQLGFSPLRSCLCVNRNFNMLGRSIIDKIALLSGNDPGFTFDLDGEDHLRQMVESGRGGFLVSGHVGNWDIAGNLLNRLNVQVNVVIYDAEHERIKHLLERVMTQRAVNFITIGDGFAHLLSIRAALERGELVCIHGDRFIDGARTISENFLGKPARFPAGPFLLPLKFKVPVSFVFAMKESPLHYHFYATPPWLPDTGDADNRLHQSVRRFIEALERTIKLYPDQWFNYYDFWQQDRRGNDYSR